MLGTNDCAVGVANGVDYVDYYVKSCGGDNTQCPLPTGTGNTACQAVTEISYPGALCGGVHMCNLDVGTGKTVNCVKGICQGKILDATCTNSDQCNPGLYCNGISVTCVALLAPGADCLFGALTCDNQHVCSKNLKCVKYMSQADGDECT